MVSSGFTRWGPAASALRSVAALLAMATAIPFQLRAQTAATSTQVPASRGTGAMPAVRIDSLLDLEVVIQRALAMSPTTAQSQAAVSNAESERRIAFGEYLPTLTGNAGWLNSNISSVPYSGTLPPSSYSAGLASGVDLFTGGRRGADRTRARADLDAALAANVSQRYQVTYAAESAFYETLRGADLVGVALASVAEAEQGLRYAEDRVRAGTTTRSDALRAQLELTTSRQLLVAALDTQQTAAYALGRLVGTGGPVAGRRPASLAPRPLAVDDSEVVRLAIEASPAVQTAQSQQRADEATGHAARTQYVPDLRLTAGYSWANQSPLVSAIRPGWTVLLGTTYPIFDGFHREDDISRADAASEVARVTTLDVIREARAEAERLLSGLRFAEQNITLAGDAVQSADEDLRVQTERYRAGISTELDQLTSELAFTQAQIGLVAARYNYQLTRAQLEALVGRSL
jgi:outer membrane protein TolC